MQEQVSRLETLNKLVNRNITASSTSRALVFLTILNLVFTFTRFHDFTGMKFLGIIKTPIIICIITGLYSIPVLSNKWSLDLKVILFFLVVEIFRGLFGFFVIQDFVINDASHFYTWRDLFLYFISISIPISLVFSYGKNIRLISNYLFINAVILSLWAMTHRGFGPGGHIGDENDLCLVLDFVLPFTFLYLVYNKNGFKILIGLFATLFCILGIVSTNSRGGFLGFFLVIVFQFILSRKKIKWIFLTTVLVLIGLPFVPKQYFEEIKSIKTESKNGTGTIDERLRTWGNIMRMWKDPKNTLTGVGLNNLRWQMKHYELPGSGVTIKSLSGRHAHSFYFQVLGDLGVWGIFIIGLLLGASMKAMYKTSKAASLCLEEMKKTSKMILLIDSDNKKLFTDCAKKIDTEMNYIYNLSLTMLCSWLGFLGAATGISVLYYPSFWLLVSFSTSIYIYWNNIEKNYNELNSLLNEN